MVALIVDEKTTVPAHPLGVKPSGNAFAANHNLKVSAGLFRILPDELWLSILEWLDPTSLVRTGSTCKALYAFSQFEDLWKTFFVR